MIETSSKNPYRPGVGVRPLYLAGRDAPLRRFDAMLRAAPEQQANMRVTGLRGVGKTVLLETFAERAQEHGWEPAFMELQPGHNTDVLLSAAIGSLLERTQQRLSRMARLRSAAGRALRSSSLRVELGGGLAVGLVRLRARGGPGAGALRHNRARPRQRTRRRRAAPGRGAADPRRA